MAINVSTTIFNVIKAVMVSTVFTRSEMRDVETVVSYLETVKEQETAAWIKANKVDYLRGLLEGFDIDNSQKAQLKDIHTRKYL